MSEKPDELIQSKSLLKAAAKAIEQTPERFRNSRQRRELKRINQFLAKDREGEIKQ